MISPGAHRRRILVVDDEPAIRELCRRVLTEEGFEVDTASNGKVALTKISKQEYELYLVDIKMPEVDGKELYESLQKTYLRSAGRVIFITGSAIGAATESFLQNSGRPILLKPFTTNELKAIITQTFKAVNK